MEHIMETIFDHNNKSMSSWNAREQLKKLGLHCGQWTTKNRITGADVKPTQKKSLISARFLKT